MDDILTFKYRLAEAIVWCAERASINDVQNSLRTPALQPSALFCYPKPDPDRQQIVDTLVANRAKLLQSKNENPIMPAESLAGGQLLLYYPYANLADGAAEASSEFFFDADNIPPWDTWLGYFDDPSHKWATVGYGSYLVSWVPPQMIELANAGVRVNPEECIEWAANVDNLLARQLKATGLLE